MDFPGIVKGLFNEASAKIEHRACPDQYVGILGGVRGKDFRERRSASCRPPNRPCVILILESPHTDEFVGEPAPAKGKTGKLIRDHIETMQCFQRYLDYGLILMNAVPYQCSIGYPTSWFRDAIFRKAWGSEGSELFVRRLTAYMLVGDVVANCCTRGSPSNEEPELRALVQLRLKEAFPELEPMRRTHPSSWYSERNRNAEWKYKA